MNADDRNAVRVFKGLFGALSSSVRRKYEGKSRGYSDAEKNAILADNVILDALPFVKDASPTHHHTVATPLPTGVADALSDDGFIRSET